MARRKISMFVYASWKEMQNSVIPTRTQGGGGVIFCSVDAFLGLAVSVATITN